MKSLMQRYFEYIDVKEIGNEKEEGENAEEGLNEEEAE